MSNWQYLYAVDNVEVQGMTNALFVGIPIGLDGVGVVCFSIELKTGGIDFRVLCHAAEFILEVLGSGGGRAPTEKIIFDSFAAESGELDEMVWYLEVVPQIRELLNP